MPMVVASVTPAGLSWRAVAVIWPMGGQFASQLFHQSGTIVVSAVPRFVASTHVAAVPWRQKIV